MRRVLMPAARPHVREPADEEERRRRLERVRLALHLGQREEDVTWAELGLFAVANEARASFDDEIELFLPAGGLVVRNDEEAAG